MWCRNLLIACVGTLVVSGCGMRPLYGPSAPWKGAYPVHVAPIAEREGQLLRRGLLSLFSPYGQTQDPLFDLKTEVTFTKDEVGLRRDETAQRARIRATATYTLYDKIEHKPLFSRTKTVVTSYTIGDRSSTASLPLIVEEKDAKARVMEELARSIHADVVLYLQEHSAHAPKE
ncbi:MAG: hypothetical protein C0514_03885 [Candidatus Puniceispirillum sp.]|nr:hypothetical protein [Candidatus Puniceispirillum sp.]